MAKANVHTVPHEGGWANRREGAKRVSKVFKTKAEAQAAGRKTAMRDRVEHLIQNRDGAVSERNSYGNDQIRQKHRQQLAGATATVADATPFEGHVDGDTATYESTAPEEAQPHTPLGL